MSNIQAHYDLTNGMFSAFLSRDMTYSCGIFPDLDADLVDGRDVGAVNGALGLTKMGGKDKNGKTDKHAEIEDELEASQLRKIQ